MLRRAGLVGTLLLVAVSGGWAVALAPPAAAAVVAPGPVISVPSHVDLSDAPGQEQGGAGTLP
jgi:hypothetical protein